MSKDYHNLGNPSHIGMREYVVTLYDYEDNEGFYDDMETDGGSITIPDRMCECCKRRPLSRNTHYHLTYDEAKQVLEDDRVKAVELNPAERGLRKVPFAWSQTSNDFDKIGTASTTDINWGLARSLSDTNPPSWGFGATVSLSRSLYAELSGKNVDIVVMDDGVAYPSTLELQQNSDGTGYPRLVQYNWLQHNPEVNGEPAGIYDYRIYGNRAAGEGVRLQEHGAHCTGTCAGNTQGWARDANIYGLTYDNDPMYVKAFHLSKPINPVTGIRNPTVMNNSWGYRAGAYNLSYISEIYHRGTLYTPDSGDASLGTAVWASGIANTVWLQAAGYSVPTQDEALMADFEDLVNAGIVVVVSAGNSQAYQDVPDGPDWNNYYKQYTSLGETTYYYHRGSSPGNSPGVITAGAAGRQLGSPTQVISQEDYRCVFSNFGPGVDVYAAGEHIQSCSTTAWTGGSQNTDPRVAALGVSDTLNNQLLKIGGTSMSGPQICGILACLAEKYPRMTSADALNYIKSFCPETMVYTLNGFGDETDLGQSKNTESAKRYMLLKGGRIETAAVTANNPPVMNALPSANYSLYRNSTGQTFPKTRRLISRNNQATFSLSTDNTSLLLGDVARVTLTTTNIPNGTKVPYIITSTYKGPGESVNLSTGFNLVSNAANTYQAELYNSSSVAAEFGTTATKRRHKINMSTAATPTFELDPAGYSAFTAPTGSATTFDIDVGNLGTFHYTLSGNDRDGTAFTNENDRHITINKGDTLRLIRTSDAHPLYVKSSLGNGTTGRYFTGVTGAGADLTGEILTWNTTNVPVGTYYYQCSAHYDMWGYIYVQPTTDPFQMSTSHAQWQIGTSGYTDDGSWEIDIPWEIPIFGTNRNKIYVNSNSFITFDSRYGTYEITKNGVERDRIMYMGQDGSTPLNYILKKVYGTSPNRYLYVKFQGKSVYNGSGNNITWEAFFYENDVNNIYMQVVENGRYISATDYYPFHQDEVLGGIDSVGYFTINNNSGYIDIQPAFIPTLGGSGININIRLGIHNSPSVNILCQD